MIQRLTVLLRWLVFRQPGRRRFNGLDVVLVDEPGMISANRRVMKHEGSTDVISCCYDPLPGEDAGQVELIVNVDCAATVLKRGGRFPRGWSLLHEIVLYTFHGWDHVCGGRDHTRKGRLAMRRRELQWIRAAEAAGLLRAGGRT